MSEIYLDNNIFVSIHEKRKGFQSDVIVEMLTSSHNFFYSSAHIQEANRIIDNYNRIQGNYPHQRLNLISLITGNNYLYEDLEQRKIVHNIELPKNVYKTIHLIEQGQSLISSLLDFIDEKTKRDFREQNSLSPEKLNNYSPEEIVEVVENVMKGSITELIQNASAFFPKNQEFGLSSYIAGIFELLDLCGFWKDSNTYKSNYARLWDSNHAFFASYCHYFVSDDKRTREKTKVVYHLYQLKTKVIDSSEFIDLIINHY
jgi:uncharacterized protein YutD